MHCWRENQKNRKKKENKKSGRNLPEGQPTRFLRFQERDSRAPTGLSEQLKSRHDAVFHPRRIPESPRAGNLERGGHGDHRRGTTVVAALVLALVPPVLPPSFSQLYHLPPATRMRESNNVR